MGINVLSLFDGMSCARLALEDQGIDIDKYYTSEIDNIGKVVQQKYPSTIPLGDVTNWKNWDIEWDDIDLITSGSPCQGFSFAGKRLNFEDPRSKLFFVFVDILNHCRSVNSNVKYLLENVKMAKEHEVVISRCLGVNPIEINSALLTAQNRKRLYWCNFGLVPDGMFGETKIGIPQPKDKGILLKDILEKEVSEKYYLSSNAAKRPLNEGKDGFKSKIKNGDEKGATVFAQQHKLARGMDLIASSEFKGLDINKKAKTLRVGGTQSQTDKHNFDLICVASRGRNPENPKSREVGLDTEQQLEPRFDGKTNCLTSVQKDNLVMQLNPSTESNGCQPYQQNRVYDPQGISPALQAQMSSGTHAILEHTYTKNYIQWDVSGKGYKSQQDRAFYEDGKHGSLAATRAGDKNGVLTNARIRRLTPTECCRLQGVPDDYFFKDGKQICSDTAIYRALGNGWTIPVISYLFSFLDIHQPLPPLGHELTDTSVGCE